MASTQQRLLSLLKQRGPSPIAPLAKALSMTSMGARQHLEKLETQQLVSHTDIKQGKGRPSRHWLLTDKGHQSFGDRHNELAISVIESVIAIAGTSQLDAILAHRHQLQLSDYLNKLDNIDNIETKLHKLAQLRSDEGYMARIDIQPDHWLLIEDHCPICSVAMKCQGLCKNELALFQTLLAPYEVMREQHLIEGGQRCVYRISSGS